MGIRDIVIRTTTIPAGDTSFEVRGLTVSDVMLASMDYGPQLAIVFAKLKSGDIPTTDLRLAVLSMSREFPEILAAIICLAADDYTPEMVERMRKVPMAVTLEAVEAIFKLSFASEAEVKKLTESLTRIIAGVSEALTTALGRASDNGIGASDAA